MMTMRLVPGAGTMTCDSCWLAPTLRDPEPHACGYSSFGSFRVKNLKSGLSALRVTL